MRLSKVFLGLVLLVLLVPNMVAANNNQGELELIGVPSDVVAGRFDNRAGVFTADLTEIEGAYIRITYDDMNITSKRVEWNTKDGMLLASVNVLLTTEDATIEAGELTYWEEEDRARFKHNVVVQLEDGTFYGEDFLLHLEDEQMEFFGPFRGQFSTTQAEE